ncbi:MAG: hypothetical protein ACLPY2_22050 [Bryobacteraceae bacterium]
MTTTSQRSDQPISEARLAANRANAKKSTGPKTPAGKLRSAANASRHGFAGNNFAVVRLENPDDIDKLKADLVATYQPINSQEMLAIERAAMAQSSIFRSYRLESGIFTACLNESLDRRSDNVLITMTPDMVGPTGKFTGIERCDITRAQNRNYGLGAGFHRFVQKANTWSLFLRYQAQAERNYRRAIEDLDRLRSMRDELANEQLICEQPPVTPEPLCTPFELNPFALPHPDRPPEPKQPLPNEPTASDQPAETKPVTSPAATAHDPNPAPDGPEPRAES